ncbi:helix-turn-helix domain-containing protein [Rothia uropygialis]|uniref:helix-turn-helix domain-containing protein n=1 Tax=Kocuria sp. 36 TaxID=1415402 RepID=UPI00101C12CA|nr:transcriptional regulator [Kocuria sp. 36]
MDSQQSRETPVLSDAETLRRVVSPERIRVYELLLREGPSRVSAIAASLGMAVGSASHHLRVLNEEGFVHLNESLAADRRSRFWEAIPGGIRWRAPETDAPEHLLSAISQARSVLNGRRKELQGAWDEATDSWPQAWRDAATDVDSILRLSPDQATQLQQELIAVIDRWRTTDAPRDGHDVMVVLQLTPVPQQDPD